MKVQAKYGTLELVPSNEQAVLDAHNWAGMDVADWIEPMLGNGWQLFKYLENNSRPEGVDALECCLLLIQGNNVVEICMVDVDKPGEYAMSLRAPAGLL